ncbi:MAG: CDP-diacylglycerol--serine O-phosphatidyltransferase [Planctomycetes bacterium RBG_13_62_9]|nr:MAG: CDP-diacylglycerol--serine O-phosphatidyltransferase [Planctomycetes bacterium RBG_13_62_9]
MDGRHQTISGKPQRRRGRLFRRERRQRVKYITVLPSLVTILNGVFGFTAIVFASKADVPGAKPVSYFAVAGYMVLLAMIADMLDGRLARMSQSTSSFGGQLDSLCDMISFGIAPAFLMLKVVESSLDLREVLCGGLLHRFIWLAAIVYISCAAIRLARFNVENEENEAAHMSFVGLPSPGAAGVVISLIIFHQQEVPNLYQLVYILPFITLGVGVLMVSRIQYPHVLNVYLRGKQRFSYLIQVLLFLGLVTCMKVEIAMVLIFGAFAGGSLVKWLYFKAVPKKTRPVPANPAIVGEDT